MMKMAGGKVMPCTFQFRPLRTKLVDTVIAVLGSRGDTDELEWAFFHAGFLLEKTSRSNSSMSRAEFVRGQGGCPEVISERMTPKKTQRLKSALIDFVEKRRDHPWVVSAIYCLSEVPDWDLDEYFTRLLKYYLRRDPLALYQAIIGLSNHGTPFPEAHGRFCAHDVAKNRRMARNYLKRERLH